MGWLKRLWKREREVAERSRSVFVQARINEDQPFHPDNPNLHRPPWVGQDHTGFEFASLTAAWLVRRIFNPQSFVRYLLFPLWLLLALLYFIEYVYRLEPFYRLMKVLLFAGALAAAVKYLLTG